MWRYRQGRGYEISNLAVCGQVEQGTRCQPKSKCRGPDPVRTRVARPGGRGSEYSIFAAQASSIDDNGPGEFRKLRTPERERNIKTRKRRWELPPLVREILEVRSTVANELMQLAPALAFSHVRGGALRSISGVKQRNIKLALRANPDCTLPRRCECQTIVATFARTWAARLAGFPRLSKSAEQE